MPLAGTQLAGVPFPSPGGSEMAGSTDAWKSCLADSPAHQCGQLRANTLIAAEGGGGGPGHVRGSLRAPGKQGAPTEGLPPILEAGVLQVSHTGLPRSSSRYAARTHAGVLFHPRGLSLGAAGRAAGGICGWPVGWSLEALADPRPWGPMLLLLLVCPVVDFLGTFLVEDGQDPVSQQIWRDKAT